MWHPIRRRVALVVVLSVLAQACSTDGDHAFTAPEAFDAPSIEEVESSMREAGVNVVASVESPVDEPWLTITANQMASMAAEVSSRGGLSGRQLDEVMPPPVDGAPPFAYWIAAWLHDKPTERAAIAARWYPEDTDWTQAPDLLYARATLLLFMADVAEDFDQNLPPLDPGEMFEIAMVPDASRLLVSATDMPLATDVGDACLVITDFFTKGIGELFNKLRLPGDWLGKGFFGFVGGLLATLWNTVVSLAKTAVEGLVRHLTEPVMRWVGKAIAIAGIVSHISSYLDGWNVELAGDPESIHWGPPSQGGLFRLQPAVNHRPWDASLRKCAQALNVTLPHLLRPGANVEWTVGRPDLIIEERRDDVVPSGGRMPEYRYRVPNETHQPPHSGDMMSENVLVRALAPRSDLNNVLTMARRLISGLIGGLVPDIPVLNLRAKVEQGLNEIIRPVLAEAERAITGALPTSVLEVTAVRLVTVSWHTAPTTTTIPRPDSTAPGQPGSTQPPPQRPPFGGREEPPCEDGCGESVGDPHLVTVDGHRYEFQGAGEFILLRNEDRSVDIQVRYEPLIGIPDAHVSFATAVATKLGDQRVVFQNFGGRAFVDGEPLLPGQTIDFGPDGVVESFQRGIWVEYHDGTQMYVLGGHIIIDPSEGLRTNGVGLVGPVAPGGLAIPPMPDGTVLPDPGGDRELRFDLLYKRFGVAWRVPTGESLFPYGPGEGPQTYNLDDFPNRERGLLFMSDLPAAVRMRGAEACVDVSDESMRESCVFDVAVTGDITWAADYVRADELLNHGPLILVENDQRPVEGRAGVPTLQLRSDPTTPGAGTSSGRLVAAEGTVLIAKTRLCPIGAHVELVIGPEKGGSAAATRVPLCQDSPSFAGFDDDDEYLPTEAYVLLPTGGVYEVTLVLTGMDPTATDVDIYVDPDPIVVRASGDDLSVFGGIYRLEHMADTVVFVFSHPGGNVVFPSTEGQAVGEACGKLERGGPTPGEDARVSVWRLNFCGHNSAISAGYLRDPLTIPMVVFNRTGSPVEVTLGPPD